MIDEIDKRLLEVLQADAKASNVELAAAVGLTGSSVFERVRKLEQRGIITGYGARVDPAKVGKELLAFVRLNLTETKMNSREALEQLTAFCLTESDILECHDVAGEDCVVLKIRCRGTGDLQRHLGALKDAIPGARSVTSIVLETLKEGSAVRPASADALRNGV